MYIQYCTVCTLPVKVITSFSTDWPIYSVQYLVQTYSVQYFVQTYSVQYLVQTYCTIS